MAATTFTCHDLRGGTRLGTIPFVGSYSSVLNGAGALFGTVDLGGPPAIAQGYLDATIPRRGVVWVDRDGTLVDAYIIWARQLVAGSRLLALRGASLWSYFQHRRLRVTKAYNGVDQLAIAKDLIDYAQAQPGGNIGVATPANTSGVLRQRNPIGYDFELKVIGTLVEQLAAVQGGFDFAVEPSYVNDMPAATFRTYYPRRGRRAEAAGVSFVFGFGKNLLDVAIDEDESERPNTVLGVGAGEDITQLQVPAVDTSELDAGYPLLETSYTRTNIYETDTLSDNAHADLRRRQDSARWTLHIDPTHPLAPLGSWDVGDDARVVIPPGKHPRFPAGHDSALRILERRVTPSPDGGPEAVTLTMGAPRG